VEQLAHFLEAAARRCFGSWTADQIELIRSELSSTGSRYTTLARFPFDG
jgi:2'-5' RNA ligase